ncbi:MAG TPA: hypothetical protein GX691_08145 [Clostridia bacterium]|nr:hypothetical protein [Clostridia bacterium]
MDAHSLGVARSVKELTGEIATGSSIGSVTFANEVGQYVVDEADLTFKYEEVEAQKASVTIQGVTIEVNAAGADGNKYSVVFVDPGDADQELSVSLEENTLTVILAKGDSGITSTATEIVNKINNDDTLKTIFTASGTGSTSVNAAGPTSFSGGVDAGDVIEVSDGTNSKKIAITDKTATSFSTGDDADFGGITITLTEGKTLENLTDTTKEKFAISVTDVEAQAAQFDSEGNLISEAVAPAGIDISSQEAANEAITIINDAIETVSTERSKLGAYQNRLEHTINNLGTSAENLTAAESRIRDVDMAKEMMEFTKNNIISQAATAMLAQANMMPQLVLQLLQ